MSCLVDILRRFAAGWPFGVGAGLAISLVWAPEVCRGEETNPPPMVLEHSDTNSAALLSAVIQLQGQLMSNQLAIEESNRKARESANRDAQMLSNGLLAIERAVNAQQVAMTAQSVGEMKALQSSHRTTLIAGGVFTGVACAAMILMAWFQWRLGKAWARLPMTLPASPGAAWAPPHLEWESPARTEGSAVNSRLLSAMEQLERRIQRLEHGSAPTTSLSATAPRGNGAASESSSNGVPGNGPLPSGDNGDPQIEALLQGGKTAFKAQDWDGALARFEEVLVLAPNHGEALVRKGSTLERLQKLNEAFDCYDRAIAADASRALAYLHKGGLYNRLERYKEALECYEKALQAHDERRG